MVDIDSSDASVADKQHVSTVDRQRLRWQTIEATLRAGFLPPWAFTRIFIARLVYVIFGVTFACLYHQARLRNDKLFRAEKTPWLIPNESGFSSNLCDCFSEPRICALGCCCPCIRWADTLDRQNLLSYWKAFCLMFVLLVLSTFDYGIAFFAVVTLGVVFRQRLRSKFQMESYTLSSVIKDSCVWCWCQPCAIIQEAREEAVLRSLA